MLVLSGETGVEHEVKGRAGALCGQQPQARWASGWQEAVSWHPWAEGRRARSQDMVWWEPRSQAEMLSAASGRRVLRAAGAGFPVPT